MTFLYPFTLPSLPLPYSLPSSPLKSRYNLELSVETEVSTNHKVLKRNLREQKEVKVHRYQETCMCDFPFYCF